MEKFAVDLDKVLDDFEFSEEQAVRNPPYICQDLPAKKYQRPPFQRINLAEADFSPSKLTSSPFIPSYDPAETSQSLSIKPKEASVEVVLTSILASHSRSDDIISESESSDESYNELPPLVQEAGAIPDLLGNDFTNVISQNLPDLTDTGGEISHEPDVVGYNLRPASPVMNHTPEPNPSFESLNEPVVESSSCIVASLPAPIHVHNNPDVKAEDLGDETFEEDCSNAEINNEIPDKHAAGAPAEDNYQSEIKATEYEEALPEEYLGINKEDLKTTITIVESVASDENVTEITPVQYFEEPDISDDELEKYLQNLEEEESIVVEIYPSAKSSEEIVVAIEEVTAQPVVEVMEETKEVPAPLRPNTLDIRPDVSEIRPETDDAASSPVASLDSQEKGEDEEISEGHEIVSADDSTGPIPADEPVTKDSHEEATLPSLTEEERRLGKVTPFWVPDADALNCMQCELKFTVIKRRHHCRACGRVLCSKCCDMRASIEYLNNQEHRVCELCFRTLTKVMMYEETDSEAESSPRRRPNPNNPMEYCSTVPPPLQASPSTSQSPPSVLVPVLKREGAIRSKGAGRKVIFSDGIRPGGDLAALDEPPPPRVQKATHGHKRVGTPPGSAVPSPVRVLPPVDPTTQSFLLEQCLPPLCLVEKGQKTFIEPWPREQIIERLVAPEKPPLVFAVNRHLLVSLKIVKKDCCMGQKCWIFTTRGMATVGQDEIIVLLQMTGDDNEPIPVEVFMQLHYMYQSADKGDSVGELGYWSVKQPTFLDSRQHGGFLFVRPTFQCVQNIHNPAPPYLVAILIHRLELPWARQFPLRLMLRLGAEFRYYPCSLVSVRHREPVYYEIGQTIMKLLADFRDYTYTLPTVRGLKIHMEAQQTTVLIPRNRYDQVVRALNNSNDPVLALAGSFSPQADAHLVCMQSKGDEVSYSTSAINIHEKPRRVTGASFVVFNGSLKAAGGVEGKSHIVEDGLMVEVSTDTMAALRGKLRACEDWSVRCGTNSEELIQVTWCEDDKDFNKGVVSEVDGTPLDGVPSIRVHNCTDYMCTSRLIRWTEVFILKCEDGPNSAKISDPLEVNRLSENIARATCIALTKAQLLDLLVASGVTSLALRATLAPEMVCYEIGSNGQKLPPVYMKSLDNELIPVIHKANAARIDATAILELVFHILDQ